jgi:predicted amidohydrolase
VLPEMFTNILQWNPRKRHARRNGSVDADFGESQNAAIIGSVVIEDNSNLYNRMLFIFRQGNTTL